MSIKALTARMLLAEHQYKPIGGTIVTIGRNTCFFTPETMDALLVETATPKRHGFTYQFDTDTMQKGSRRISQESFFGSFCDARVISLDVSDYEKAELICDIQGELPQQYLGFADFVYDGGSLDNIFDVAATLKNISRLLKPGGRFLASNNGGPHPTSYLKFSADWFMDFFAINQYEDCKTYICAHPDTLGHAHLGGPKPKGQIVVYSFNPYVTHATGEGYDCSSVELQCRYQIVVFAEKGRRSTDDKNPIQKHYRVDPEINRICNESAKRFLHSPRPVFSWKAPSDAPRIDSSDYPEQLTPVAAI